jgi:hypothetical protein
VIEPIDVALEVIAALDACGIPYSIGGSVASSLSGEPRGSLDVDILVDLAAAHAATLVRTLGEDFYADVDALARAAVSRSSTNVIHRPSGIKVDFFVAGTALERLQLQRRLRIPLASPDGPAVFTHSPEDVLLQKLYWYRLGGGVSERQWRDVLGIIVVQGPRLDRGYLSRTAAQEGLTELLERAFREGRSA